MKNIFLVLLIFCVAFCVVAPQVKAYSPNAHYKSVKRIIVSSQISIAARNDKEREEYYKLIEEHMPVSAEYIQDLAIGYIRKQLDKNDKSCIELIEAGSHEYLTDHDNFGFSLSIGLNKWKRHGKDEYLMSLVSTTARPTRDSCGAGTFVNGSYGRLPAQSIPVIEDQEAFEQNLKEIIERVLHREVKILMELNSCAE